MASRPSYKAMAKLASEDKKVTAQIVAARMEEAVGDFAEPIEANGTDWKEKLKVTEKGALAQTIENAVIILRHDPQLKDCLAYNEMDHNIVSLKKPTVERDQRREPMGGHRRRGAEVLHGALIWNDRKRPNI